MPFAAALSTSADSKLAFDEVSSRALEQLGGPPALALTFFTPHHTGQAEQLAAAARERLGGGCLLGCTGESIVGNDQEIEQTPAMALWLARWTSAVQVEPFHLTLEQTSEGYSLLGLPDSLEEAPPQETVMLLLGDPFSFPIEDFLREINETRRGLRVLGGMASGGRGPGRHRLLLGDQVHQAGAVGVLLRGPVGVRSIVSQGCRPIGRHFVVTKARDNLILELGGKPPLEQLQAMWQDLEPRDQQLFQQGLHVGRVINEYQGEFHRGDFLVRNVLGLERETKALAITDRVRVGQTIQFHVRDSASADEDLHELLQMDLTAAAVKPAGALVFTCNGRGTRLFAEPHHDARAIRAEAGDLPLAGFFCQGEIGPIGGQNFIHGFTASVVLFEDA